ncbi:MAG: TIGR04255 family protein [Rubrivivax sp.]|nr:TIGR04255 family protein [Rubrivivax sp.]
MPDAKYPHLSKAPIAEAVVEFKVSGQPASSEAFERFAAALGGGYPKLSKMEEASFKFLESGASATPVSRVGVRLASADDKDVVIGSIRSFVVSRLAPYQSWDLLVEKVKATWPVYREHFLPGRVIRAGVRCINRIELGDSAADLDTVFRAGPQIPPDLPQGLGQYSTRVVVPMGDAGVVVAIVQALEPGAKHVVLDIDAFVHLEVDPDDATLFDRLELLHDVRNRAFFASLHRNVWEKYL